MKRLLLVLYVLLTGTGCVSYKFAHVNPDGSRDETKFFAFIFAGNASKISSSLTSSNYSRRVSVGQLAGAGDAAMISAVAEGAVAGAVAGATKAVKP